MTASGIRDFTAEDVQSLRDFSVAVALGYARYLDFRRLEVQNRALSDANRELEEANREIREATERKSRFLASMSHELRTPMNAIKGFTSLVLRRIGDTIPERHRKNLATVMQASDHLLALINDLLDLSKIEAGRMDVNIERFEVKSLVTGCCAEVEPLVMAKPDVRLAYDVPDDVGVANTDQGRLRQMLMNLLSNAIKFTDKGEVAVRASVADGQLVVSVSDTGTGIPADALGTVFEEFRQVKGTDPQHKGTGLGLPITKGFAELLGGSISAQSEAGKGSTFTVRVPLVYH